MNKQSRGSLGRRVTTNKGITGSRLLVAVTLALSIAACKEPAPRAHVPDETDEAFATLTRTFYALAPEWHGMSVRAFGAQVIMLESPTPYDASKTCFRYLLPRDWVFVEHRDCFDSALLGRAHHFHFGQKTVSAPIVVRDVPAIAALFRAQGALAQAAEVERKYASEHRLVVDPDLVYQTREGDGVSLTAGSAWLRGGCFAQPDAAADASTSDAAPPLKPAGDPHGPAFAPLDR